MKIIILLINILISITYSHNCCTLIDNSTNLSESMINFNNIKNYTYFKGKNFQVKLFDVNIIKHNQTQSLVCSYYIAIAPLCNEEFQINDIKIVANENIKNYYNEIMLPIVFHDYVYFESPFLCDDVYKRTSNQAYYVHVVVDNFNDDYQKKKNMSDNEIIDLLTSLTLEIKYNNYLVDKFELNNEIDLNYIDEDSDILEHRDDLKEIFEYGYKRSGYSMRTFETINY